MKTIILSAGTGSRLKHDKPKSLIDLDGRKLIEVQLNQLFLAGIKKEDINLVIGYKEELFEGYKYKKFINNEYRNTHQIFSICCASSLLNEKEILVVYGDVLFEKHLIDQLIRTEGNFIVPSYADFKKLWTTRGDYEFDDLETFKSDENGKILEIGNKVKDIKSVEGQFMGVMYFRNYEFKNFLEFVENFKNEKSKKEFMELQTTTFLNYLIKQGIEIKSIDYDGYFMELDSENDLKLLKDTLNL